MATQNYGEQRIDVVDIPPIPTDETSSSSSSGEPSDETSLRGLICILIMFVLNAIQVVASLAGLWVSIVHEHPDHKLITWAVGYASGCVVMFPLLYFDYRTESTLNLRQREAMKVFWITMSFFFLVWCVLGFALFGGGSSSDHGAPRLETLLLVLLYVGCPLIAMPAMAMVALCCLCLPRLFCAELLDFVKEKSREASTPDSLSALPTYKFKSKENGRGDHEGGVLAAGTKKEHTLSGEDAVCCICLRKYADNDKVRELPCCSHFFHVGCVDKWLKMKARCPLCQSELPGAGGSAT